MSNPEDAAFEALIDYRHREPSPRQLPTPPWQPQPPPSGTLSAWREEAVCQTTDPEIFFPEKGQTSLPAKRVCQSCPVRLPCLTDGLYELEGVWGGLNPDDRRDLRRQIETNPSKRGDLLMAAARQKHPSPTTHLGRNH